MVLTISSTAAASYALNGSLALGLAPPGLMLPDSRALNFRLRKLLSGCDLRQRRSAIVTEVEKRRQAGSPARQPRWGARVAALQNHCPPKKN